MQDEAVPRGCCCVACRRRDAGTDAHSDARNGAAAHCLHAGLSPWLSIPTHFTFPWQQCLGVSEPRNSQAQGLSPDGKQCHPLQAPIGTRMKLPMFDTVLKTAAKST